MEIIINDYIEKVKNDYNILGVMLAGSYVTESMGPNSDIDIFFIWDRQDESMRGRQFYKNIEFEYFISPEWKYYDRLKTDTTSQQIYATGKIVLDSKNIFRNIQQKAIDMVKGYSPEISISEKIDYSFYVETVMKDGLDIIQANRKEDFYFLAGVHIPKFCNIVAKIKKKYPIYERYAFQQLRLLDEQLYFIVKELYDVYENDGIYNKWMDLCNYVLNQLGNIDVKDYRVISKL